MSTPSSGARHHRTWSQRLTIVAALGCALVCFVAAGALAAGQWVVSNRQLVVLDDGVVSADSPTQIVVPGQTAPSSDVDAPPSTFPQAEPAAKNFLITGTDNNACVDPDSPYAPAFGDRSGFGERSDTIMVWRVNPSTNQVAILSFPRDLYVTVSNGSKARINTAYTKDDPNRLRDTIFLNFQIPIDHYVQVDFCAFKTLVDAVGGVSVPFLYPARDPNTGLDVPAANGECYTFDGDHALAYVRSRYYEYEDPPGSGNWRRDGTSDLGRISRQQDFLRRTVAEILSDGFYSPDVVAGLIDANRDYIVTDEGLTPSKMLEFAGVLRSLDPAAIASYQIEADPQRIGGADVLVPRVGGDNMQAVLAVFQGRATLGEAPEQVFESTTTASPRPTPATDATNTTETTDAATDDEGDEDGEPTASVTTLPSVDAQENDKGISPPREIHC